MLLSVVRMEDTKVVNKNRMEDTKVQIYQIINEAIHLDSMGEIEKAYVKYIQSVLAIGKYLMDQFGLAGFPYEVENCEGTQKILTVGRQCWERLDNLLHNKRVKTEKEKSSEISSTHVLTTENSTDKSISSFGNELALNSGTFTAHAPSSYSTTEIQTIFAERSEVTPLEVCRLKNAKLCKTFQSRIKNAKNPMVKENLSLEFHRQIADNISIAKAKERELLMEQQKREKKALQQATKILSQSKQIKLTELESEKCQLYANILQYGERERWTRNLQIRLASHPTDPTLIEEIAKTTLKRVDHPLAQWLLKKQKLVCEKCAHLVESHNQYLPKEQTTKTCEDIEKETNDKKKLNMQITFKNTVQCKPALCRTDDKNNFNNYLEENVSNACSICDTCMLMLGLMYEKLNESETAQDICYRLVEDIVLGPMWQYLISLFRYCNKQTEHKIAKTMKAFADCKPKDFGLEMLTINKCSYDQCASKLKEILSITSPVHKLQSLVQAIQKFCEFQRTGDDGSALTPTLLGADDLIPMLSYILVQTGLPCLLSECQALEQLLDQRYLLGEEGYCLTSCQMAFKYLETQADKLDS